MLPIRSRSNVEGVWFLLSRNKRQNHLRKRVVKQNEIFEKLRRVFCRSPRVSKGGSRTREKTQRKIETELAGGKELIIDASKVETPAWLQPLRTWRQPQRPVR